MDIAGAALGNIMEGDAVRVVFVAAGGCDVGAAVGASLTPLGRAAEGDDDALGAAA